MVSSFGNKDQAGLAERPDADREMARRAPPPEVQRAAARSARHDVERPAGGIFDFAGVRLRRQSGRESDERGVRDPPAAAPDRHEFRGRAAVDVGPRRLRRSDARDDVDPHQPENRRKRHRDFRQDFRNDTRPDEDRAQGQNVDCTGAYAGHSRFGDAFPARNRHGSDEAEDDDTVPLQFHGDSVVRRRYTADNGRLVGHKKNH